MEEHDPTRSERHRSRGRSIVRGIALALPVVFGTLLAPAGAASASPRGGLDAEAVIGHIAVNFTDCPVPTAELECIGTGVSALSLQDEVGSSKSFVSNLGVFLFHVHEHADGTFVVDPTPFATRILHRKFNQDGVQRGQIKASVPMSDNTTVKLDVTLVGTGPITTQVSTGSFNEVLCPSGVADGTLRSQSRDATATGTAIVEGTREDPTTASGPPTLYIEHDHGHCTAV